MTPTDDTAAAPAAASSPSLGAPPRLDTFQPGERGRVVGFNPGSTAYRRALLAMGLTPGTPFTLVRRAPLGDPLEIEVRGFLLTLRGGEASILKIERLPE